ncbi:TonB-dependent receptor [Exilibacterium tricleocarpae]|uniref:TonB-dependent receptor n=1 Tax=Exilibacterium tricleocarpae TaxID=2591008 RepID=A0A545SRZ0_9GAMM|nr:TonB-dependent receptor [Exilibacterium tricleocarpae]TQV67740.1 TonB-dependent receptor [Exilibacterium tricleocarpae]
MLVARIFSRRPVAAALAVASMAAGAPALAQSGESFLLEEITVTAQKREEKLTDVPVAVSVLNADQIDAAFANNLEGLQAMVPSVSFRKGNTTRNSAITVRGIGTISFSTAAEPSVSTVVDGVVLGRSGQAFADLYDLERIEVLRGPQGTLFGKNASAGVVNMITRRPGEEFSGSIEASLFQDNEYSLKLNVSGPLTENARGSLTVLDKGFDGYIRNVFNNRTTNGYDRQGLRGMLEIDASDDLSFLFIAESYEADDDCCTDLEVLPSGRNPNSEAAPDSNGVVDGNVDLDLDQRRIDHDLETRTLDETTAFSVQIEKGFGDYQLSSITAFRAWDNTEIREGDFTSIGGTADTPVFDVPFQLHDVGPQEWRQISQELRLASPQGEMLEYQLGLFYWNIDSERNFTREASCQNNDGQNAQILADNPGLTCNANDIVSATAFFNTEFTNYALFGQGTLNLSDNFRLLFGLRFTDDEISFNHNRRNLDPFGRQGVGVRARLPNSQFADGDTNFSGDTDETNVSGKIGIQWDFGDAGMAYGTFAQGYKGPGFNVFYNMAAVDQLGISEETSESFEIGYKYAAGNLVANVAIFTTDIEDFQANNADNASGVTITRLTNAGDVSTEGVEVDFIWRPLENLQLSGGIASVKAEIDDFSCPLNVTVVCDARSGLDVPFAPDLKYSLMAEYIIPTANMDIILNASFVHTDEQQSDLPDNDGIVDPEGLLPEYDIFNASVAFSFNDDKYRITLIGKNLGDESYVTTNSGDGFRFQVPRDADRYFGVAARASF